MKVFLDANVLFSASRPDSNIAQLIAWLLEQDTAVSSDVAVEEARRNLTRKRPTWLPRFDALLARVALVPSVQFTLPVPLAQKDVPLLCAAIRDRCEYFVTGDHRDFGHLMDEKVLGVEVVSLLTLARILAERRARK